MSKIDHDDCVAAMQDRLNVRERVIADLESENEALRESKFEQSCIVDNLAMLVRRLIDASEGKGKVCEAAKEYLSRKELNGNIMRTAPPQEPTL